MPEDIRKLPFDKTNDLEIETLVTQNISISKQDWDAHETSWDFQRNELTPDVPQNEITILQQGEISIEWEQSQACLGYAERWEIRRSQITIEEN